MELVYGHELKVTAIILTAIAAAWLLVWPIAPAASHFYSEQFGLVAGVCWVLFMVSKSRSRK